MIQLDEVIRRETELTKCNISVQVPNEFIGLVRAIDYRLNMDTDIRTEACGEWGYGGAVTRTTHAPMEQFYREALVGRHRDVLDSIHYLPGHHNPNSTLVVSIVDTINLIEHDCPIIFTAPRELLNALSIIEQFLIAMDEFGIYIMQVLTTYRRDEICINLSKLKNKLLVVKQCYNIIDNRNTDPSLYSMFNGPANVFEQLIKPNQNIGMVTLGNSGNANVLNMTISGKVYDF